LRICARDCASRDPRRARRVQHRAPGRGRVPVPVRDRRRPDHRHRSGARARRRSDIRSRTGAPAIAQRRSRDRDRPTGDERMTSAATNALLAARAQLERIPLSLLQLAMRIAVSAVFFNSGLLKINSWEFAIKLFEDEYKVPFIDPVWAARLAAFNELTFPVLLVLGLAPRLATLPLLGMILGIQPLVYPEAWCGHLLWGSILLFLLSRGPGAISLDALIERRFADGQRPNMSGRAAAA